MTDTTQPPAETLDAITPDQRALLQSIADNPRTLHDVRLAIFAALTPRTGGCAIPAGMTTQLDLYDLRRREVQALGAALSCRDWYMMEKAYNSLRDKLDNAGFTVSGPPATPKPPAGGDAGAVQRVLVEKLREVAALEDSNLRKHGYAVRKFATEAADYLAALALPAPVVEGDAQKLWEALSDLVSWFPEDGPTVYGPWIIKAGEYGADGAVAAARAALGDDA